MQVSLRSMKICKQPTAFNLYTTYVEKNSSIKATSREIFLLN